MKKQTNGKLEFKNLTVVYDGDQLSQKKIKRIHIFETLFTIVGVTLAIITLFIALYLSGPHHPVRSFIESVVSDVIIIAVLAAAYECIEKKIIPPYYDTIDWLMSYNFEDIEVGWFNDRYIMLMFHDGAFALQAMYGYNIQEEADKSKPIYMTIDLTSDIAKITTYNKTT